MWLHEGCSSCHSTTTSPPPGATCTTCHDDLSPAHGGPVVGKVWTYQDLSDPHPKTEGGYNTACATCHGDFSGEIISPHGGYDTTTNKCKVCHAVHRAEGAYYLLRANSSDDACNYCHIGAAAHSNKVVYKDGIYTADGHTMGASADIPDSSISMTADPVTIDTADGSSTIKVRSYDATKKKLYRVTTTGRGGYVHPVYNTQNELFFQKVGPTPLSCSSCHQVHNALSQIWRPSSYADVNVRMDLGYKLLRRFPGASTASGVGANIGATTFAKVMETTATVGVNVSTNASLETTYTEFGETFRTSDYVVGDGFGANQNAAAIKTSAVNQYALTVWCADCHNLNIGGSTYASEIGQKLHGDRTHPVGAARYGGGPFQCYSCHRGDMRLVDGAGTTVNYGGTSCSRCHYYPSTYRTERDSMETAGINSDFPHSGTYKLLGNFSITSQPPAAGGAYTLAYETVTVTPDNLDAVCLRCHNDTGVHQ